MAPFLRRCLCCLLVVLMPLEAAALTSMMHCDRSHSAPKVGLSLALDAYSPSRGAHPCDQDSPLRHVHPESESGASDLNDHPKTACEACGACFVTPLPSMLSLSFTPIGRAAVSMVDPRYRSVSPGALERPPSL
jgi:hypothetical protein